MYFFLVLVVIMLITVNYYVSEYKKKAIKAGESELSLTDKNILPFCRTCKICSGLSFMLMVISGLILIIAPLVSGSTEWIFLDITKGDWKVFHLFVALIFVASFTFHTYIHWNWFKAAFARRFKTV
jgi:uncharacterized protein YqhQ